MRRTVLVPLVALILLHIVILFAGFFAPYGPVAQHRSLAFAPPTQLHFVDACGNHSWRPFVYRRRAGPAGLYEEDMSRPYPVGFFVSGAPYRIAGIWSSRLHLIGIEEPATLFPMGTDGYGRDQFSRFLYGGQISLLAGPLAAALALIWGLVLGTLSGYYGKWMDEMLMGAAEIFLSLPWLYLLLAARAFLPLNLNPEKAFLVIVGLLGCVGWARPARLFRGVVLSAKEREYVLAARGFNASDLYLLRRHILPQTVGLLLIQASLLIPHYIMAEVTMSFLGLGVSEPTASWGLMLANLQQYEALVSQWWLWLPALLLIPVFLAYISLANALSRY